MKYPIVSERFKEAIEKAHMSQQELADRSGVSKVSISQYVNGSHSPSNIKAGAIGEVLKVNPLWLMGFENATIEPFNQRKHAAVNVDYLIDTPMGMLTIELKEKAEQMNEEQMERLLHYANYLLNGGK